MTVNTLIYIPNDTEPRAIVEAIAILSGYEKHQEPIGNDGAWATWVRAVGKEVTATPCESIGHYEITIGTNSIDHSAHCASLFIYPSSEHPGCFLIYGGYNEYWQKVGRALVDVFGGYVDDNDCDARGRDYANKKPRKSNCPSDGKPWQDFQQALWELKPLS